jgi:hypothetical protein
MKKMRTAKRGSSESGECMRTYTTKHKSSDSGKCLKTLEDHAGPFDKHCRKVCSGKCLKTLEDHAGPFGKHCRKVCSGKRLKTLEDHAGPFDKHCRKVCSGECMKSEDLDLLVTEGTTDRFVGAVAKDEVDKKMRVIEAVVDSGAEESVAPRGCFPGAVVPSRMSRAGGKYRAANAARIPNLGQQRVPFVNEDGGKCGILFQIAEVERPLISATQLAASGNSVIISGEGGKIVNDKTGKVMRLTRRGGVLVLKMRIPAESGPGFPGPGR